MLIFFDSANKVRREAAEQLWADRDAACRHGLISPGMAEYIDLLRSVEELGDSVEEQLSLLGDIKGFVLNKELRTCTLKTKIPEPELENRKI